jgi:DNA-binding response OmpR family regulator
MCGVNPSENKMKRTVLIVDDDPKFLTFLSRTLKRAGFQTLTASDGCEVRDLLLSTPVDVLVLDLQMPGMNGWEVLRALRRREIGVQVLASGQPRPKVIVVSGRGEDETVSFAQRLGADAYLTKPFWRDQILATVREVLGSEQAGA